MKKFLAILMTVCLLAAMLCVTAFAASDVLTISAIVKGKPVVIGSYGNFEDGWNAAMKLAGDEDEMKENGYERIVVDLHTDWEANKDGQFSDDWINGKGFDNDTIYIPAGAKVTLNMNSHTIDRGLTKDEDDGEVMFINDDADVIINNGTITGGYSNSEGGGLYIEGANVTLNNVHIVGNRVDDDDGAGIAAYYGTTLTVNGGSFDNNVTTGTSYVFHGGAVYISGGSATFNGVEFKNNNAQSEGAAIYADECEIEIDQCIFDGNGKCDSAIFANDCTITASKSTFTNNTTTKVLELEGSKLIAKDCTFSNNRSTVIDLFLYSSFQISDSQFTDNTYRVMQTGNFSVGTGLENYFDNCTFDNNDSTYGAFSGDFDEITFYDCSFGDSKFDDAENMHIIYTDLSMDETAISVTVLTKWGEVEKFGFKFFDYGWNYAMDALDRSDMITGITVDLYKDWNAVNGVFGTLSDGFSENTIFVPAGKPVTLNMNGHTINRGLTEVREDGEVIYVASGANLTINDGTITGGFSNNGAGGIHICSDANVTLNNVHVDGNTVQNDDGGAIAVYDDATLTMNGGSLSNNKLTESLSFRGISYGVLYLEDANASLSGVDISNNKYIGSSYPYGLAVYMTDSTLSMKDCTIIKNNDESANVSGGMLILSEGSSSILDVDNCKFDDNGTTVFNGFDLLYIRSGTLRMKNSICNFNGCRYVIFNDDGHTEVTNSTFTDNTRGVFGGDGKATGSFTDCTFSGNTRYKEHNTFYLDTSSRINFNTCDFGDATFNDRSLASFDGVAGVGSIFGEGSLSMIVSFVALIASVAAIVVSVSSKKKVTANGAEESDEEEQE